MNIPLFDLNYDEREEEAVLAVLRSRWISMGPKVREFEERFARAHEVTHGVALANCTVALHLSMLLGHIGPGDEVLVPSLTFVATVNAVRMVGATPVFVDVCSLDDWTMCPEDARAKVTVATKGIIPMHYGGYGADMTGFRSLADSHGLFLVEDACHAPLGRRDDRALGSWGDVACYSFYSNKNLAIGEGGMLITKREDLADRARLLRSHGMTTSAFERHRGAAFYDVTEPGYNYRMDDIHAALGLVQFEKLRSEIDARKVLVEVYRSELTGVEGVGLPFVSHPGEPSPYILPVRILAGRRHAVVESLRERGIGTSMHYPPVHLFKTYRREEVKLALTEQIGDEVVTLPLYGRLQPEQVREVCLAVKSCLRRG